MMERAMNDAMKALRDVVKDWAPVALGVAVFSLIVGLLVLFTAAPGWWLGDL